MRSFLIVLILIFGFQSWTKADDIREIEIERMKIGDSLLDFFSEKEIKKNQVNYYKSDRYISIYIKKNFENYDALQLSFLKNDLNKIGLFKAEINFHSDVRAQISIKVDKIESK